jgi:hypothetical protein
LVVIPDAKKPNLTYWDLAGILPADRETGRS